MQVLEFDTPEDLLSNEESAFSKMVQSTGAANAQYLKVLSIGGFDFLLCCKSLACWFSTFSQYLTLVTVSFLLFSNLK